MNFLWRASKQPAADDSPDASTGDARNDGTTATNKPSSKSSARTASEPPPPSASAAAAQSSTSAANVASAAKPKAKQSTKEKCWQSDALNHPHVRKGYIQLSEDGKSFYCTLCDATVQTKHDFKIFRLTGSGGHEHNNTHKMKVQARELSEKHGAKRKAEGKEVASRPKKKQVVQQVVSLPKRQATLATKPARGKVSCLCKNDRV